MWHKFLFWWVFGLVLLAVPVFHSWGYPSILINIFILIISLIFILVIFLNRLHVALLRKQLRKPVKGIPKKLKETWKNYKLWDHAPEHLIGAGTVGISAAQVLYHIEQINPGVINAIDDIYRPDMFNSFEELVTHLSEIEGSGSAAWDGALSTYKGRFGEELMAEYLRNNGHVVSLAESTNQEGWDAVVDGHVVNFKAGLSSEHINEHLGKFPNIPVMTVAEHSNTFESSSQVTVLNEISGHEIEALTKDTMEHALELENIIFDMPAITVALACARNFTPFFQGKSDFSTAIKNTSVDSVAIGGGSLTGGLIGFSIGTPIPVIGNILGGLIGAAVGAAIGVEFAKD